MKKLHLLLLILMFGQSADAQASQPLFDLEIPLERDSFFVSCRAGIWNYLSCQGMGELQSEMRGVRREIVYFHIKELCGLYDGVLKNMNDQDPRKIKYTNQKAVYIAIISHKKLYEEKATILERQDRTECFRKVAQYSKELNSVLIQGCNNLHRVTDEMINEQSQFRKTSKVKQCEQVSLLQ